MCEVVIESAYLHVISLWEILLYFLRLFYYILLAVLSSKKLLMDSQVATYLRINEFFDTVIA